MTVLVLHKFFDDSNHAFCRHHVLVFAKELLASQTIISNSIVHSITQKYAQRTSCGDFQLETDVCKRKEVEFMHACLISVYDEIHDESLRYRYYGFKPTCKNLLLILSQKTRQGQTGCGKKLYKKVSSLLS